MRIVRFFKYATFALALGAVATACSDDNDSTVDEGNNGGNETETTTPANIQFVVTSSDAAKDLKSPAYLRLFTGINQERSNVSILNDDSTTVAPDAFTQISWNATSKNFTGYIYGRGALTLGGAGLRTYQVGSKNQLEETSQSANNTVTVENFGNTGIFGEYSYAAQISNPYVMRVNAEGVGTNIAINDFTDKYAIEGTMPAISGIVDLGNNQLAMTLYYSNKDCAAVAFANYDLTISDVITDERIGASYGAQRSVRYDQVAANDNGDVYVFSGQTSNDEAVGALKIDKGTSQFNTSYHFNIGEKNGGYRFRKVYHITGDYFLLECFPETGAVENMTASGKLAVVNMDSQTFTWVTGCPSDVSAISIGFPDSYNGKIYLPISGASGMNNTGSTESITPTVYAIGTDGVATPFMTFQDTELLKAITFLK